MSRRGCYTQGTLTMGGLFSLEATCRKINKYHADEFWEPGVFRPDVEDFNVQKSARATERAQITPEPRLTLPEPPIPEPLDRLTVLYNKYKGDHGLSGMKGTQAAREAEAYPSLDEDDTFDERNRPQTLEEFKEYVARGRKRMKDIVDIIFDANKARSPSAKRRRTSQFVITVRNETYPKAALSVDKEYMSREELAGLVDSIVTSRENEEAELMSCFAKFDPSSSGVITRQATVEGLLSGSEPMSEEQAEILVGLVQGSDRNIGYRDFVKSVTGSPVNSKRNMESPRSPKRTGGAVARIKRKPTGPQRDFRSLRNEIGD